MLYNINVINILQDMFMLLAAGLATLEAARRKRNQREGMLSWCEK